MAAKPLRYFQCSESGDYVLSPRPAYASKISGPFSAAKPGIDKELPGASHGDHAPQGRGIGLPCSERIGPPSPNVTALHDGNPLPARIAMAPNHAMLGGLAQLGTGGELSSSPTKR